MASEETRWFNASSEPTRSRLRWIAIGLLVLVGIYVAASVTLQSLFDAEYVEEKANEALTASAGDAYQLSVDAVDWNLLLHSVQVEKITLRTDTQSLDRQPNTSSPPIRATLSEAHLQGIHLWDLLRNGDLRLHTVTFRQPHVHLGATRDAPANEFDRAELSVHELLASSLPWVELTQVNVEDGSFSREHGSELAFPADSLWGLSVHLHDVKIHSSAAQDSSRVLLSENLDVSFDGYRHLSADSLYALTFGQGRVSSQDSSLRLDELNLTPTVSDEVFMNRHEYRANRFDTAVRQITLDGIELRPFIEDRAVLAEVLTLDSLVVDVYRDNHLPAHPDAPLPKTMPHEAVRGLERALRIDTTRVTNSHIAYTKRDEDGSEPGTITFEDLSASLYNVTNDPQRMTSETPAVIDARTRVAGAGLLETTIRLPLLSPHLTLSYEGSLGPMDARAFNSAFIDLSGIRIESGQVDSLWFEADIHRGVASGTVQGIYRNLEIEMLDQESREQDLPDRIKTFVVDDMALEPKNTPEDSLRTGTIEHEYEEGDTFLKFLWHSLRSGLYSLVGL